MLNKEVAAYKEYCCASFEELAIKITRVGYSSTKRRRKRLTKMKLLAVFSYPITVLFFCLRRRELEASYYS
jgi:hypothetical protein